MAWVVIASEVASSIIVDVIIDNIQQQLPKTKSGEN
jgi:hypothetical protein